MLHHKVPNTLLIGLYFPVNLKLFASFVLNCKPEVNTQKGRSSVVSFYELFPVETFQKTQIRSQDPDKEKNRSVILKLTLF